MRLNKEWDLPPPPPGPENVWYPYVKVKGDVPWGYFADADDPHIMHPIPRELDLLELAKKYLKEYSYKEVAEWLSKKSGRYISAMGLMKRVKSERRRRKLAEQIRWYQRQAEEAAAKAEKLERSLGGIQLKEVRHPKNCSCSICTRNSNR